jgi:hypothetical protein
LASDVSHAKYIERSFKCQFLQNAGQLGLDRSDEVPVNMAMDLMIVDAQRAVAFGVFAFPAPAGSDDFTVHEDPPCLKRKSPAPPDGEAGDEKRPLKA